jgi:predicted dehydrogenase
LTGILGPAKKVTAMSASLIKEREFRGEVYQCDAPDTTLMVLDFGEGRFAFVHGTLNGSVSGFGQPSFFGTKGSIVGTKLNDEELSWPTKDEIHFFGPHVTGPHIGVEEAHVYEDMMQLVDLVREGTPTLATAEHACHVIEVIEAGLKSAEEGRAVELKSSFEPIPV